MKKLITTLSLLLALLATRTAQADNSAREAAKHFQRGVDLYNDGDFRGALVEFKTAYGTWPRANVLYDIGQAEYQLLDYAGALRTMGRYLAETGPTAPHRQEVEASVEVLRGRVGRVALISDPGCEVSIDDQSVGTTPLDTAILVSVGQRKLLITCPNQRSAGKRIEIAAGETLQLELRPAPMPITGTHNGASATRDTPPPQPGKGYIPAWIVTGVLLLGTVGLGTSTLVEESHLSSLRNTYPVSAGDLNRQNSLTTGLAIGTDVIGACTIVAAGVATYLTIRHKYERGKRVSVGMSMRGVQVGGTF